MNNFRYTPYSLHDDIRIDLDEVEKLRGNMAGTSCTYPGLYNEAGNLMSESTSIYPESARYKSLLLLSFLERRL